MDRNDLKELEEALRRTPDNIGLRLNYALKLFKIKDFDESEKNYHYVLRIAPENTKAKQGLIELYFAKSNFSAVIVIAEELVQKNIASEKILELYAKSLLRQNNITDAQEIYEKLISRNPFYFDEELDSVLEDKDEYLDMDGDDYGFGEEGEEGFGFDGDGDMDDFMVDNYLAMGDHLFLEEKDLHLGDIIGMEEAKATLKHRFRFLESDEKLIQMYGIKKTGGILLFGPGGCGKTHLMKTIPFEFDCKVLPYEMFRLTDQWSFKQDGMLHYFFNFARANAPCAIFFDEVDNLMSDRNDTPSLTGRVPISKFMAELDNVRENNNNLIFIAATNAPWFIDFSLLRPGRFDSVVYAGPPTALERKAYIESAIQKRKTEIKNIKELVEASNGFSYAEINQIFDIAIMHLLSGTDTESKNLPALRDDMLIAAAKEIYPIYTVWLEQFYALMPNHLKHTSLYKSVEKHIEKL